MSQEMLDDGYLSEPNQSLNVIKLQFCELKNKATFRTYDKERIVPVIVFTNCDSSERNPCARDYSYSLSGGMLNGNLKAKSSSI